MAVISKYYLAAASIAERTGLITSRYRVRDGRFVLSYMDMKNIRFTPEELISGIGQYIQEVDENEAMRLIIENGYKIGKEEAQSIPIDENAEIAPDTPVVTEEQEEEQESENENENESEENNSITEE